MSIGKQYRPSKRFEISNILKIVPTLGVNKLTLGLSISYRDLVLVLNFNRTFIVYFYKTKLRYKSRTFDNLTHSAYWVSSTNQKEVTLLLLIVMFWLIDIKIVSKGNPL